MNVILKISFRNLVRQKRRNLLLGTGIAFGMCILIMTNAFAHGITDILINKVIVWMNGHIRVKMVEKDTRERRIIRDKERIKQIILEHMEGDIDIYEGISTNGRAVGNGAAESVKVLGLEVDETFLQEFELDVAAGNPADITNPAFENPIILDRNMAENLNVQLNDMIHIRFQTVYGQVQTARFQIVTILKASNPFLSERVFVHANTLKPLLGYQDYETEGIILMLKQLKKPGILFEQANRLHAALSPNIAGFWGIIQTDGKQQGVRMFAVVPDTKSHHTFASSLQITEGVLEDTLNDNRAIVLSRSLTDELGVNVGDQVTSTYETKFEGILPVRTYRIGAIFEPNEVIAKDMVFLHANQLYETFFPSPPQFPVILPPKHPLRSMMLKEWNLLERSPDEDALDEKYKALEETHWRGAILDVQTMYERASSLLQVEQVMDLIALFGVSILFSIVVIGLINTLRMSIRERTREIGTIRAIGMQKYDVCRNFLMEVFFLTLFASITGIVLAFILIKILSLIPIQAKESFLTICLVNKHFYFLPTVRDIVQNLLLIIFIMLFTTYFPARRASKMSIARALRHFE